MHPILQSLAYNTILLKKHFMEFCEERLLHMGLSKGLLFFLIYIGKHPGCSPGQLSSALHQDAGHTTRCVERLEKSGLVLRSRNKTDKRIFALNLTAKGTQTFAELYHLFEEWDTEALQGLSKEEQDTLLMLLNKIIAKRKDEHVRIY